MNAQPAIAQAVPASQRRESRVPSTIRSHRPVLTGAMPNVTAVATAAPVRAAEVRNVPWKVAVAADAASSAWPGRPRQRAERARIAEQHDDGQHQPARQDSGAAERDGPRRRVREDLGRADRPPQHPGRQDDEDR